MFVGLLTGVIVTGQEVTMLHWFDCVVMQLVVYCRCFCLEMCCCLSMRSRVSRIHRVTKQPQYRTRCITHFMQFRYKNYNSVNFFGKLIKFFSEFFKIKFYKLSSITDSVQSIENVGFKLGFKSITCK